MGTCLIIHVCTFSSVNLSFIHTFAKKLKYSKFIYSSLIGILFHTCYNEEIEVECENVVNCILC